MFAGVLLKMQLVLYRFIIGISVFTIDSGYFVSLVGVNLRFDI